MNPPGLSIAILALHWLIIIGLSFRVVMRRPPIGVSLAWLAVICSLPFVGAGIYLLFGEKRLGHERVRRIQAQNDDLAAWQRTLKAAEPSQDPVMFALAAPLQHHAENAVGFPPMTGNEIQLLGDYESIFDRLVADIDAAGTTVDLDFYAWQEGGRVADVTDALVRAARRGVRCRGLADAVGSKPFLAGRLPALLRRAGVEFHVALPAGVLRTVVARTDLRNHRKIAVMDGRVAYSGSQNLVDPRFFKQDAGVGQWVDAMVRVTGPAVRVLAGVFELDWSVETGRAFHAPPPAVAGPAVPAGATIQVVPSGPDRRPEAIHQLLLSAIYSARRQLVLTTPYFVPDDAILTALVGAAMRGVSVTLIVPAHNDSVLVRYASVAHFEDLLSAGVRIALFEGGLLHTKSLTIDGLVSVFGSVNLDMRSLWLNFEISLLVYDSEFTGRLCALQSHYLQAARCLDLDSWRRRPTWRRLVENSCRLAGPLL